MSPLGRMVFPRAEPEGKPSSRGETFRHVTHTGMAYLYNMYIGTGLYESEQVDVKPAGQHEQAGCGEYAKDACLRANLYVM